VPDELVAAAEVELTGGIPFLSDAALEEALAASDLDPATADAILEENADARIGGLRTALSALAVLGVVALFATRRLPTEQPAAAVSATAAAD
jgi:hypothetical protein